MDVKLTKSENYGFEYGKYVLYNAFTFNGVSYDLVVEADGVDLEDQDVIHDNFKQVASRVAKAWKSAVSQVNQITPDRVSFKIGNRKVKILILSKVKKFSDDSDQHRILFRLRDLFFLTRS